MSSMRWRAARARSALVSVELQSGVPTSGSSVSKSCTQDACRMHAGCNQTQSYALNVRVGRVEELRARGDQHQRQSAALSGTQRHFTAALTCASKMTGSLRLMPRISAFAESTSRCTVSETTERRCAPAPHRCSQGTPRCPREGRARPACTTRQARPMQAAKCWCTR